MRTTLLGRGTEDKKEMADTTTAVYPTADWYMTEFSNLAKAAKRQGLDDKAAVHELQMRQVLLNARISSLGTLFFVIFLS